MGNIQPIWKSAALQFLPEYESVIVGKESPYALWMELFSLFKAAYREPKNETFIENIYRFTAWCEIQPRAESVSDDLLTCVNVCFFEDIPRFLPALLDVPNWFTAEQFSNIREGLKSQYSNDEISRIDQLLSGRKFRDSQLAIR